VYGNGDVFWRFNAQTGTGDRPDGNRRLADGYSDAYAEANNDTLTAVMVD
jgi:hypothetical protein